MKKINFKQPKYILPAVLLIPILFVGLNLVGMIDLKPKEDTAIVKEGEINIDMPNPNMDNENMKMRSKYENMMNEFGKIKDYAAVQGLEDEFAEGYDEVENSLYSDKEIAMLDSLEQEKQARLKELNDMQAQTIGLSGGNGNYSQNEYNNIPQQQGKNNNSQTSYEQQEDDEFERQIALLQKIARGENIYDEPDNNRLDEEIKNIPSSSKSKKEEEKPDIVHKAKKINANHFNTIQRDKSNSSKFIKAMLDETIKAEAGSRLRIRLLDDIEIDGHILRKGTYLYAIVNAFTAQRIQANITSVLVGNELLNVSLSIYDNDGIEGFYVPASAFRDFQREASSQALSSNNMNMNQNSGQQSFESVAVQTLQSVYQSTTTAISNNIRKNKAKLKYNTEVYLINTNK